MYCVAFELNAVFKPEIFCFPSKDFSFAKKEGTKNIFFGYNTNKQTIIRLSYKCYYMLKLRFMYIIDIDGAIVSVFLYLYYMNFD